MTPEQAVRKTAELFPFENYMWIGETFRSAYENIALTVLKYLKPGASILDFGCGPCDKTAVLRFLGFKCSGYDDLLDGWHQAADTKEKIQKFASECEIDLRLPDDREFPFQAESFDMIMLHDVLEHLHDSPRDLLVWLLTLCRPGGYLFVTVPNAANVRKRIHLLIGKTNLPLFDQYYWSPDPWRGHVREYVKDDLAKLCDYLCLDIRELRGCDHMLQKVPKKAVSLYLLATRVLDSLKDSWLLVAKKPQEWTPLMARPN